MILRRARVVLSLLTCVLGVGASRCHAQPKPVAELGLTEDTGTYLSPDVTWLGFSPDGKWLAVRFRGRDEKARVRVWRCRGWEVGEAAFECHAEGLPGRACAFHPTAPILFAAAEGNLYSFGLPLKDPPRVDRLVFAEKAPGAAYSVDLGADGKMLRVTTADHARRTVRVDVAPVAGERTFAGAFELRGDWVVCQPALSPDGSLLAVGSKWVVGEPRRPVRCFDLWSVTSGKKVGQVAEVQGDGSVAQFSPDGRTLAVGAMDGSLSLYDVRAGKLTRTLTENWTVSTVDFHPTRPLLAFGTFDRKGNPNVRVADLPTGRILGDLTADQFSVCAVRFSPDGKWLATVGNERVVRVWKLDDLIQK
jgi:WD40 repeat protein